MWGEGLPVPSKVVPELVHTATKAPAQTPELLLKVLDKAKGISVLAGAYIQKDQVVTLYAGNVGNGLPSKYVLPICEFNKQFLDGICTPQWPFERYVAQAQVGHLISSCRTDATKRRKGYANVFPALGIHCQSRDKVFRDKDGVLQVPFYALKDIQAGQELVWDYNFKAVGRGSLDVESLSEEEIDEELLDGCAEASGEGGLKVKFLYFC